MRKLLITLISVATAVAMSSAAPAAAQGTLKVAIPSNVNTFDPAKTKIGEEYIVNFLVYSGTDTNSRRQGQARPCRKLDRQRGPGNVDVHAAQGR